MLAIMNVGKYVSTLHPSGNVDFTILKQETMSISPDVFATDGENVLAIEYNTNIVAKSTDGCYSWTYNTAPYPLAYIVYNNVDKKYYALSYSADVNDSVYLGSSANGLEWSWKIVRTNDNSHWTVGHTISIADDGINVYVASLKKSKPSSSDTSPSIQYITYKFSNGEIEEVDSKSSDTDTTVPLTTPIMRTDTTLIINYVTVCGTFGIETSDLSSTYKSDYLNNERIITRSSTNTSSSPKTSWFYYTLTGRKNTTVELVIRDSSNAFKFTGYFTIGNVYYVHTQTGIAKAGSIIDAMEKFKTENTALGDVANIKNVYNVDKNICLIVTNTNSYLCRVN